MNDLSLSLRQRKLIHYLQQKNSVYTTGEELAGHLHVSARTIAFRKTKSIKQLFPVKR